MTYKTQLFKSKIEVVPTDELCEHWKSIGFQGMEVKSWNIPVSEALKYRQIAEKHDFPVHSVTRGRAQFNCLEESVRRQSIEETKAAIHVAAAYGASNVLFVPCSIPDGMVMPNPWDYDIEFDSGTLQVKSLVLGDSSDYVDYIARYNESTEMTLRALEELIPVAAKEGIILSIEQVWNNLWCTPEHFAALIEYFGSPWIGSYFDTANCAKYSRPELWVQALGPTLVKMHVKGYRIERERGKRGGGEGTWCQVQESTIDWKAVRDMLEKVGFNGWVSVEERGQTDEQYVQILEMFDVGILSNDPKNA